MSRYLDYKDGLPIAVIEDIHIYKYCCTCKYGKCKKKLLFKIKTRGICKLLKKEVKWRNGCSNYKKNIWYYIAKITSK
ncbi:MAG: hypothetical protein RR290_00645 [Clostridia bacterium]